MLTSVRDNYFEQERMLNFYCNWYRRSNHKKRARKVRGARCAKEPRTLFTAWELIKKKIGKATPRARSIHWVKSLIPPPVRLLEFHRVGERDRPKFDINFFSFFLSFFFRTQRGRGEGSRRRGGENSMVFFTSCSSHFPRAALAVYRLHFRSLKSSRSCPSRCPLLFFSPQLQLLIAVFAERRRKARDVIVQTGFSLLKSITAGRRDERTGYGKVEKGVGRTGGINGGLLGSTHRATLLKVAELISKTPDGVIACARAGILRAFPDELDDGEHPPFHLPYPPHD